MRKNAGVSLPAVNLRVGVIMLIFVAFTQRVGLSVRRLRVCRPATFEIFREDFGKVATEGENLVGG